MEFQEKSGQHNFVHFFLDFVKTSPPERLAAIYNKGQIINQHQATRKDLDFKLLPAMALTSLSVSPQPTASIYKISKW